MTPKRCFVVLLIALCALPAWAGTCAEDIAAVDKALTQQYKADRAHWWDAIACAILMDTQLRKDALVTKEQVKDISYWRNVAYMQHARGDEKLCVETLKAPKRLLHLT